MAALGAREGIALRAVHVDHGLQPESAAWAAACRAACGVAGVALDVLELRLEPHTGASLEAAAREARYAALAGSILRTASGC